MGYTVEERNLSVEEIVAAHKAGKLEEVFGVGTAAVVSFISRLADGDYVMDFDVNNSKVATKLKKQLNDIRVGLEVDKHGWLVKI
jgi:branched-chain amino acid aminotransferase